MNAIDPDLVSSNEANNLQFRIISGNSGNRFNLDEQRAELTVNAPLDREIQAQYNLIVEVSDSFHFSTCNVSIELIDVNDNAPIFEKSDYYAIVSDRSFGWINLVQVRAIDSDGDKLMYRIENDQSTNLTKFFSINSNTGEIQLHSTLLSPIFNKLNSNVFTFEVGAIEIGHFLYRSHESKAKVHITLIHSESDDDNFDHIEKYPYVIIVDQSRHSVLVSQRIGTLNMFLDSEHNEFHEQKTSSNIKRNNQVNYRILNGGESYRSFNDYFEIQQHTGHIIVKRPLNSNYYEALVEIEQKSSSSRKEQKTKNLIQIFIGGIDERKFLQLIKLDSLEIVENQLPGSEIINLESFTHHQSLKIPSHNNYQYHLMNTNVEQSFFEISDGRLRLKRQLDYETQPHQIRILVFTHRSTKESNLHENSFLFNLTLNLINIDDNSPQFAQKHYIAAITENEPTGSFVAQVNAIDIDDESLIFNKTLIDHRYSYYIVDGNDDMAFSINNDGIISTNIVLDQEIHNRYRLRVIATESRSDLFGGVGDFLADEASYQYLAQCTVEVIVIDQNDNVPVFPPNKEISASEDTQIGSTIATWTANDVDVYPQSLIYHKIKSKHQKNGDGIEDCFDVGTFSGKISLKCSLKPWLIGNSLVRKLPLTLRASDGINTIETEITVNIKRNYSRIVPMFLDNGNFYQKISLDEDYAELRSEINIELFRVPMIEDYALVSERRRIRFSLDQFAAQKGFYIDESNGIIYNNKTIRYQSNSFVTITIYAQYVDSDAQTQASLVLNFVRNFLSNRKDSMTTSSTRREGSIVNNFNLEIESSQIGSTILTLPKRSRAKYSIVSGNSNKNFMILRGNDLVLVDRPLIDQYLLKIKNNPSSGNNEFKRHNSSTIFVHIKVRPSNVKDSTLFSSPFKSGIFNLEINENEKIDTEIQNLRSKLSSSRYDPSEIDFDFRIFSGNELGSFRIDQRTGLLFVAKKLDYETNPIYRLGVIAESLKSGAKYFSIININLINVNEFCPHFPTNHFRAMIDENVPIGTKVIPIRAIDYDNDRINYTLFKLSEWNESPFRFDIDTGYLVTDGFLDFESKSSTLTSSLLYKFVVKAVESGYDRTNNFYPNEHDVQCNPVDTIIEIQIGSIDEHSPRFLNDSYDFKVQLSAPRSKVTIGKVMAIDSDSGPDGRIVYSIKTITPQQLKEFVHINESTGLISMQIYSAHSLPAQLTMIVQASSGRINSLDSLATVNVRLKILDDENNEINLAEVIDQGLLMESTGRDVPLPGWIIFLIVLLLLITFILMVSVIVIRMHQQHQEQQHFLTGNTRTLSGSHHHNQNIGSLFSKIGAFANEVSEPNISPAYSIAHYGSNVTVPPAPPCYNDVTITTTASNNCAQNPPKIEGHSTSSGRGSAEDDGDLDDVDEEIRMINESSNYYNDDPVEQVTTIAEYLARLGVTNHYEEEPENVSSMAQDEDEDIGSQSNKFIELNSGANHGSNVLPTSPSSKDALIKKESRINQPSIYNKEEFCGSYSWDYLQQWGPKYQPMSSVFAEIARLKSADNFSKTTEPKRIMENHDDNVDVSTNDINQTARYVTNSWVQTREDSIQLEQSSIYNQYPNTYTSINENDHRKELQSQQQLPKQKIYGSDGYGTIGSQYGSNLKTQMNVSCPAPSFSSSSRSSQQRK